MALTGQELLAKIKELGYVSKEEVCRATGYVKAKKDGTESFLFNSFYQASLEASTGVKIGVAKSSKGGKAGRAPSYVAKIGPKGTVLVGAHYIEEAEELADRIGIINHGELKLVDDTAALLQKLGRRELRLQLQQPLASLPPGLAGYPLELVADGTELVYTFNASAGGAGIAALLPALTAQGIEFRDLATRETSLEDIFVGLLKDGARP